MTQLVTDLPAAEGRGRRLQISVAKGVEEGARAMLISVPEVMRLDVVPSEDMVRLVVRSLGDRTLMFAPPAGAGHTEVQLRGNRELSLNPVGRFDARIAVGDREGPELARIQIGTIRHPESGVVAFTAQAIVDAELL
jgi:hypothetical protein